MNTFAKESTKNYQTEWDRYHEMLCQDARIKEKARRHYAKWIQRWKQASGPTSPQATEMFFQSLQAEPLVEGWQYRQAIFAVRLWCRNLGPVAVFKAIDWKTFLDEAETLEPDHRTLIRESIVPRSEHPSLIQRSEEEIQRLDRTPVAKEQEKVGSVLQNVRRMIRLQHLRPATEKTYLGWIKRFLYFRLRRLREELDEFSKESAVLSTCQIPKRRKRMALAMALPCRQALPSSTRSLPRSLPSA